MQTDVEAHRTQTKVADMQRAPAADGLTWPERRADRGFTMPDTSFPARQQAHGPGEPADLRVGVRPGAPLVVEICGEIDIQSAPQLREELLRVLRRHGSQLALDLGDVTFIDCAGINVLLATRRRARLEDGWVRVIRASPRARRTISLLGLQEAFALDGSGPGGARADRLTP